MHHLERMFVWTSETRNEQRSQIPPRTQLPAGEYNLLSANGKEYLLVIQNEQKNSIRFATNV